MSVSGIFKEAAAEGRLDPCPNGDAAKLGYMLGCLEHVLPSAEVLEKVASKTHIPEGLIKAAILKKALSPLLTAAGLAALPVVGIPLAKGLGKGVERAIGRIGGPTAETPGRGMGAIGGFGPTEMKMFNKIIARQALRNYQMRNLLDQMRMASGPLYGGSLFGQRPV